MNRKIRFPLFGNWVHLITLAALTTCFAFPALAGRKITSPPIVWNGAFWAGTVQSPCLSRQFVLSLTNLSSQTSEVAVKVTVRKTSTNAFPNGTYSFNNWTTVLPVPGTGETSFTLSTAVAPLTIAANSVGFKQFAFHFNSLAVQAYGVFLIADLEIETVGSNAETGALLGSITNVGMSHGCNDFSSAAYAAQFGDTLAGSETIVLNGGRPF